MEDGFYAVKNGEVYKIDPRIKMPIAKSVNVKTGVIHYPTNADRIRAMTNEELAEFMCHNVSNGTINCAFCTAAEFCRMGHNGWLDWLREEAEL